jgi:hypothetical protein
MRDFTAHLPAAAKAKLEALGMARDAAIDAARGATVRANMLPAEASELRDKLMAEQQRYAQRQSQLHRLLSVVNQWLFQLRLAPGQCVQMAPPVAIRLELGQTEAGAIVKVRAQIGVILDQIKAARSAPLKKQSRQEAIAKYLAGHALRVRPRVGFDQYGNAKVLWNEDLVHTKDDILGLLSWFLGGPAELMHAFELDQEPEAPNSLTPSDRDAAVAKLQGDLLALERLEAALLDQADAVLPRPDMSPPAYLGVEIVEQIVAAEAQASAA